MANLTDVRVADFELVNWPPSSCGSVRELHIEGSSFRSTRQRACMPWSRLDTRICSGFEG
jgi:hypothetical protein